MEQDNYSPKMAYIVGCLQKNPNVSYAEVRDGAPKGMSIAPISYGRAKGLLGLAGKGSSATATKTRKSPEEPTRTRVRRPRVQKEQASTGGLTDQIQEMENDNARLREVLDKISQLVQQYN